jgi:hypothetical protein
VVNLSVTIFVQVSGENPNGTNSHSLYLAAERILVKTLKEKTIALDVEASVSSGLHFQVVAEAYLTKSWSRTAILVRLGTSTMILIIFVQICLPTR